MDNLTDRIAALESQLAEAQARLAMAVEALKSLQLLFNTLHHYPPDFALQIQIASPPDAATGLTVADFVTLERVLNATAASVAQHTATVEQRGANEMLDRIRGSLQNWPNQGCDEVVGRAVDEIVAKELERIYAGKGSSTEFDPEYLLRRAAELRGKRK